jgi:hypothetical protein
MAASHPGKTKPSKLEGCANTRFNRQAPRRWNPQNFSRTVPPRQQLHGTIQGTADRMFCFLHNGGLGDDAPGTRTLFLQAFSGCQHFEAYPASASCSPLWRSA